MSCFVLAGLALCSGLISGAPARAAAAAREEAIVFAAASLTEAFAEIGRLAEAGDPALRLRFNFAGSQQLALQIEQGARADVYASADERWMERLQERGLLAGGARVFATNRLVVIVPAGNPGRIQTAADLARPGLKIVLGADAVPVGRYARQVLRNLSRAPGYPEDYAERVRRNVVSEEEQVKAVVGKVQLGEADAGLAYRTDVTPAVAARVHGLDIAAAFNVEARYPLAVLRAAPHAAAARRFVELVRSEAGCRVLRRWGFLCEPAPGGR
jgi:molybdate transport system substrate-binding protein